MLKAIDVTRGSALLQGIWDIYLTVFPACERLPEEIMLRLIEKMPESIALTAYLEEGAAETPENVHAMTFTINFSDLPFTYLLFLGVSETCQGQGSGTHILNVVRQRFGKPILIDVEIIDDPAAPNPQQRQQRWRFYQRNGFVQTDYRTHYEDEEFQVLICGMEVTEELVRKLDDKANALYNDSSFEDVWREYS